MATIKGKTIYICDFCKRESEDKQFTTNTESGSARILFSGGYGVKMMDQSWGGNGFKLEADLCFSCSETVMKSINEIKQNVRKGEK